MVMKLLEEFIKDVYVYGVVGWEVWKKGDIVEVEVNFIKVWEILFEFRE